MLKLEHRTNENIHLKGIINIRMKKANVIHKHHRTTLIHTQYFQNLYCAQPTSRTIIPSNNTHIGQRGNIVDLEFIHTCLRIGARKSLMHLEDSSADSHTHSLRSEALGIAS
jgi:hypothetical protein